MQRIPYESFLPRLQENTKDKHWDDIVEAIKPAPEGPWIVGGSVRRLIDAMPQTSDVDIGLASLEQLDQTKNRLLQSGFTITRKTAEYTELSGKIGKKDTKVQLLRVMLAPTPEGIIDEFDFTICQFAFDGKDIVCGQFSLYDLARKRLVLHRLSFGASTIRRMTKYGRQGYTFCQGTIVSILEEIAKKPELIRADMQYVD